VSYSNRGEECAKPREKKENKELSGDGGGETGGCASAGRNQQMIKRNPDDVQKKTKGKAHERVRKLKATRGGLCSQKT